MPEMDADAEMLTMFAGLLPAVQALQGTGTAQPDKKRRTQQQLTRAGTKNQQRTNTSRFSQNEDVQTLLQLLLRLTLRQEDELSLLRLDKAFCLFLEVKGEVSVFPTLATVANEWKRLKQEDATKLQLPLRTVLFNSLLRELLARLRLVVQQETTLAKTREAQWTEEVNGALCWRYQVWDPQQSKNLPHPTKASVPHTEVLTLLEELKRLSLREGLLHRFHSTRPLVSEPLHQATFLLQVSLRGQEANRAHELLSLLADCAFWRLLNGRLRTERVQRSPLAKKLEHFLAQSSSH